MDFNGDLEGLCPVCAAKLPALWGGGQGAGQLMEVRSPCRTKDRIGDTTGDAGGTSAHMEVRSPGRTTDRIEGTTGNAGVSPAVSLAQTV